MPHTPDSPQGDRQEGEFADLFARKARTPLRGFLPGRRVWSAVGGSAAAVLVIAGSATMVSMIDWSGSDADKVTTAADKPAAEEKAHGDTSGEPTAGASPKKAPVGDGEKAPGVVYVPVSGGAGAGAGGSSVAGAVGGTGGSSGAASTSGAGGSSGSSGGSGASGSSGSSGTGKQGSATADQKTSSAATAGYLWSDGSVDSSEDNGYWDQSVVTVKTTKALSSLKVVVRIIQTGGVASTGVWSDLGDKVSVATGGGSSELDYVVTLKAGNTLAAGTYVFKFQYNHAKGDRDAGHDRYNVTTVATDSDDEFRSGGF
ncbi:hypothetical protein [Streptomyces sp. SID13726]|uniref:hypothetical protein n=1 Tax=Streptomyces sp. SID13726 TaxID=2706058 RepID=UPI0013BA2620|nr:hypothetical protein [Streptomyces sp. SID13726]NEA98867.1 hypothetical protein [Streptomyces sp. SID13726]